MNDLEFEKRDCKSGYPHRPRPRSRSEEDPKTGFAISRDDIELAIAVRGKPRTFADQPLQKYSWREWTTSGRVGGDVSRYQGPVISSLAATTTLN